MLDWIGFALSLLMVTVFEALWAYLGAGVGAVVFLLLTRLVKKQPTRKPPPTHS